MRRFFAHALILGAFAVLAGGAVVVFGLYNVSARLGHLPGVHTLLHTTYQQSVKLYAPSRSSVPETLSDPARLPLGAGHFEQACRFCHGVPGEMQSATVEHMNPRPPHITEAVGDWQANHLFWIVDEGVKMSGMPAWPTSGRDDGVWNVVAFLEAVKQGMSLEDYNALIGRDGTGRMQFTSVTSGESGGTVAGAGGSSVPAGIERCAICHGEDGLGRGDAYIPRLDILGEPYIVASLAAYRDGLRQSGFMRHAATIVSADELQSYGEWYAARPVRQAAGENEAPDADLVERGRRLARDGNERSNTAACIACHGPNESRQNPLFPSIQGQWAPYIEAQLKAFREGGRGGIGLSNLMTEVSAQLTDDDIEALAAYYASLPAQRRGEGDVAGGDLQRGIEEGASAN